MHFENNTCLNWDKECVSIFSEKEQRALQIQAARKIQVKIITTPWDIAITVFWQTA
jgi:hypothetical protein